MTSWDPRLVADVLVNLFAAAGFLVVAYNLGQSGARAPMNHRLRAMFQLAAALFLVRCAAWSTNSELLSGLVDLIAAVLPVAALVVAEGLLRRHAPRLLKISLVAACALTSVLVILPGIPDNIVSVVLLATVFVGFLSVAAFLGVGSRDGLTAAECASVRRVILAMAILAPLTVTDFASIWSDLPMRLGALGALVMLFIAFGPGSTRARGWERVISIATFGAIATLFAIGYAAVVDSGDSGNLVRAVAVGVSGLLFAALFSESLGARSERRRQVDPLLEATTQKEFTECLESHALLGDARILHADELAPLAHPAFDALVATMPVLKKSDLGWSDTARDDGVERAMSLLKTYDATHAIRLSQTPLKIATFKLPQSVSDPRSESEIRVVQRIGELLFAQQQGSAQ